MSTGMMPQPRHFASLHLLRREPRIVGREREHRSPLFGVLISFILGVCVGVAIAPPTRAAQADVATRAEVVVLIHEAAQRWQLDEAQLMQIGWCESRFDPHAYNRASGASGVFQFTPQTWAWASAWALRAPGDPAWVEAGGGDPFNPRDNITTAAWVIANPHISGGLRHWSACV